MADYEHSSNYHIIVVKIQEICNLKDLENLKTKLEALEQDDEVIELLSKCDERKVEIQNLIREEKYQKAVAENEKADADIEFLINQFQDLDGYKDSSKLLEPLLKEKKYRSLLDSFESGNCDWEQIIKEFAWLGSYKKAQEYYTRCIPKAKEQKKEKALQEQKKREAELEAKYKNAVLNLENGAYVIALDAFKELGEYKDAKEKADECGRKLAEIESATKRKKKIVLLILLACVIIGLLIYLLMSMKKWSADDSGHWHSVFGAIVSFSEHEYSLTQKVLPTCENSGHRDYGCDICGWTFVEQIEATGHTSDVGIVTKEPTCTENGIKTYTCTVCGEVVKTEFMEKTDHIYDDYECIICGNARYVVGDIGPAGGFIFYDCDADNNSGNEDKLTSDRCGWRYLEAAPSDLKGTYDWGERGLLGTSTEIGTGQKNTEKIASKSTSRTSNAAKACLDYKVNGYDDWFLPSKNELNLMYTNLKKKGLGDFPSEPVKPYWSSSEIDRDPYDAWTQYFYTGRQDKYNDRYYTYSVRAVRAF